MTLFSYTKSEAIERADQAQRQASDPLASVFVSASAGSGKTKLLIDRLLRLMLPLSLQRDGKSCVVPGVHPGRILCLTYTKAAAAEMAGRLQARLGQWVSLPDKELGQQLEALGVPNTPETRKEARGLFIKVLDLPGGLRIETIHAFCQSLLRRFPLEAALDPHFSLIEETDGRLMLRHSFESEVAASPDKAVVLAEQVSLDHMAKLLGDLLTKPDVLSILSREFDVKPGLCEEVYKALLAIEGKSLEWLKEEDRSSPLEAELRQQLAQAYPALKIKGLEVANPLLEWLRTPENERVPFCLESVFLTKKNESRKMTAVVCKEAQPLAPDLISLLEREGERRYQLFQLRKAFDLVRFNQAFLTLGLSVFRRFQSAKSQRGSVDYNDLITCTRMLLRDPGAAWVLYKLDGGIDHLLLDEVQDTSGLQWEIAGALTEDFFAEENGQSETGRPRTIFAVGDFKQSIYSFQGAEPEQFHGWRKEFARRVQQAGLLWREPELNVSFRSVPPVLSFVDHVFASEEASRGLVEEGKDRPEPHISARPGQGGRVELWPLVPAEGNSNSEESPWQVPRYNQKHQSAMQRLAESLAQWISGQIGRPLQPGQRPLKAGDILILVPKRSDFMPALIRALKTRSVPVASFLRARVTEQLAVRDLLTLCATLLLPQDDLSLACVLTSPFGNMSDQSLMELAIDNGVQPLLGSKGRPLWDVLRDRHCERPEWRAVWERLSALYRRVDFDSPYVLLMQALGPLGGRPRILARLGPEASDAIDELLTMALNYEKEHVPSLQGFLHWVEESALDTRREAETASDEVRIMTVHGAKGLQSRLVILPDTTALPGEEDNLLWVEQYQSFLPLWVPRSDCAPDSVKSLRAKARERSQAENHRLLYVALTRASDWLVICGWERKKEQKDYSNWYQLCVHAFEHLEGSVTEEFDLGWGGQKRIFQELPERSEEIQGKTEKSISVSLPDWMGTAPEWQAEPAPLESALARPLTPSRPEGIEFGPAPAARSPLDIIRQRDARPETGKGRVKALQRGQLVHRLLQRLPEVPSGARYELARSWLSRPAWQLDATEINALLKSIFALLDDHALAPLFGEQSRAEQSVSGTLRLSDAGGALGDGRVVLGKIDRFCLGKDDLWLCDYKTGRFPPRYVEDTPLPYLRQMAAYKAVMAQLYPHHRIRCFLLWTEGPQIDELPETLLERHLWG
ncbi:double-strand break repair helicase AddA [Acetobacteraceae bacterium ESL0709]|nr:double-strand break repair helicase AddA [Acetobacteraceae bacterium ESL0697]MDF7677350.1 double-strand break repair helicase AddA [Acetobacteraceae bacterium ESL0709]